MYYALSVVLNGHGRLWTDLCVRMNYCCWHNHTKPLLFFVIVIFCPVSAFNLSSGAGACGESRSFGFLRAIAECFARLSHGLGVRPSYCAIVSKRRKLRSRNLHRGLPRRTLVSCDEISCPCVRRFLRTPLKIRYFAVTGSSIVKTVAVRYRHVAHHNKHWSQAF